MTSKTYEGSRSDRDEVSECVTYDSLIEMQDEIAGAMDEETDLVLGMAMFVDEFFP